jgi:hypothetical protein
MTGPLRILVVGQQIVQELFRRYTKSKQQ